MSQVLFLKPAVLDGLAGEVSNQIAAQMEPVADGIASGKLSWREQYWPTTIGYNIALSNKALPAITAAL